MTFDDIENALDTARQAQNIVDAHVTGMVKLCAGRLKHCDKSYGAAGALRKLKAELRDFDSRTGCWKN